MITIIRCERCNGSGSLDCTLKFLAKINFCNECHQSKSAEWSYVFCTLTCMFEWFRENQIEELGFPCSACLGQPIQPPAVRRHYLPPVPTGFKFGSEAHGPCDVCQGTKRVKTRVKETFEQGNEEVDDTLHEGGRHLPSS
jgi:hypothetical protein